MSEEKKLNNENLKGQIKKTVLDQLDEQLTQEKLSNTDQEKLEGGFASAPSEEAQDPDSNGICNINVPC